MGAEPDRPRKEGDFISVAMGGDSFLSIAAIRSDQGILGAGGRGDKRPPAVARLEDEEVLKSGLC